MSEENTPKKKYGWLHRLVSFCCGKDRSSDCDESSRSIDIGYPTNFRREDISFPGLMREEQAYIRDKARRDVENMYPRMPLTDLQNIYPHIPADELETRFAAFHPLRSSPSGHFVDRPAASPAKSTTARMPIGMPASPGQLKGPEADWRSSIQRSPSPMHRLGGVVGPAGPAAAREPVEGAGERS